MPSDRYDVVIIGNGITGLVTARLFNALTANVAIICLPKNKSTDCAREKENSRHYSIIESSKRLLDSIGAWSEIGRGNIGHYKKIEVWDSASEGYLSFNTPLGYCGQMGWIVDESLLYDVLNATTANIHRYWSTVELESNNEAGVKMLLPSYGKLFSQLVVVADGKNSTIQNDLGLSLRSVSYDQIGLVTNVSTETPHTNTARQWFSDSGILAFLPKQSQHECSVVFSVRDSLGKQILTWDIEVISNFVTEISQGRLGKVRLTSSPSFFDLSKGSADSWFKGRCVLVGSSAHVLHPLAGQGLNLSLMDAASLVECMSLPNNSKSWPALEQLNYYNRWRKSESQNLIAATDMLQKMFSSSECRFSAVRGLMVNKFNRMTWLKDMMVSRAMGLKGDLPRSVL